MILLDEDFIRDVDKCDANLKSKILSAICKLSKTHRKGRVGTAVKTSKKLREFDIDDQWRLIFEPRGDYYLLSYIWDHNGSPPFAEKETAVVKHSSKQLPHSDTGFDAGDFKILETAFQTPDQFPLQKYFERIKEDIFPKFNHIEKRIQDRLFNELGITLFPHKADMADIGKDPVVWLAFTRSKSGHYENYAQLTFHLGIGDCTHATDNFTNHFSIKTAIFHNKHDTWRLWRNVYNHAEEAILTIQKYAKRLDPSYNMMFLRKKGKSSQIYPAHTNYEDYEELFFDLMDPDSVDERFFGCSFFREYPYYEKPWNELFGDMRWVEDEILKEFSDLMYLYFWFSDDNPLKRIDEYEKRKRDFDQKYNIGGEDCTG